MKLSMCMYIVVLPLLCSSRVALWAVVMLGVQWSRHQDAQELLLLFVVFIELVLLMF